jgi:hypothetical protein
MEAAGGRFASSGVDDVIPFPAIDKLHIVPFSL